MEIKKGTLLTITHSRKGEFLGMASEDFDSDKEKFYPIRVAIKNKEGVKGLNNEWMPDEEILCRASLCEIKLVELNEVRKT